MKTFMLTFVFFVSTLHAQISIGNLKKHIAYLSSDSLRGRATSEPGESLAADYISKQFQSIGLIPKGDRSYIQVFNYHEPKNPHVTVDSAKVGPEKFGKNVIGYLDNGAQNTIIIGGHYDHLGLGDRGGSLDPNPKGKIHNGADDNASGASGVIELARYFQTNKKKEKNNFLFICFSGEELGLQGSKYFTHHPTIDSNRMDLMINMDMIGRLDTAKGLLVLGTGTSPGIEAFVKSLAQDLKIKTDSSGIGPSDHTSFYLKNVPVLHFFTGPHADYHKPTDDEDKINYAGEKEILEYIIRIVGAVDPLPKLAFTTTRNTNPSDSPRFKVTLGILPDYTFTGGLRIDGVSEGKPGFRAGLQQGDVIVQMGEYKVDDIQTYMQALSKFKKDDSTTIKVKRKDAELELKVTF